MTCFLASLRRRKWREKKGIEMIDINFIVWEQKGGKKRKDWKDKFLVFGFKNFLPNFGRK